MADSSRSTPGNHAVPSSASPSPRLPESMQPASRATVYIVDDDASVREALAWLLRSRRLLSESFASAEEFLSHMEGEVPRDPCCLLLDVRMPGMSGLALFEHLAGGE